MTVKETAAKLFMYFYQLQRTAPLQLRLRRVVFSASGANSRLNIATDKRWLTTDLRDIGESVEDVLNGMYYLSSMKLLNTTEQVIADKRVYTGLELTAIGIKMIEGVERSANDVDAFNETFNMALAGETSLAELTEQLLGGSDEQV